MLNNTNGVSMCFFEAVISQRETAERASVNESEDGEEEFDGGCFVPHVVSLKGKFMALGVKMGT